MKFTLFRYDFGPRRTLGVLYGPNFSCHTLEDTVRAPGVKLPGQTAIPAGTYKVSLTHSPRFNQELPILLGVPGFDGVRIHPGNTAADTEGCVLVGEYRDDDAVRLSRQAFDRLMRLLQSARQPVELTITQPGWRLPGTEPAAPAPSS